MDAGREKSFCNDCMRPTWHRTLFDHAIGGSEGPNEEYQWKVKHQIIECMGCDNVTYKTDRTDSESYDDGGGLDHDVTYFPPRVGRKKPEWVDDLPYDIQQVMGEIYAALQADSRYLATVGARTVLDMLIVDRIGDVGTFREKIEGLVTHGHITREEGDLIESAVEAGNASAHRGYAPDPESLKAVMDIVEAVLDTFYAAEKRQEKLAGQAAALKRRIPERDSGKKPKMTVRTRRRAGATDPGESDAGTGTTAGA